MFFILSAACMFAKLGAVSERLIKAKGRSHWILSIILLTSAVICKQGFFYGNKIVQYFQNC